MHRAARSTSLLLRATAALCAALLAACGAPPTTGTHAASDTPAARPGPGPAGPPPAGPAPVAEASPEPALPTQDDMLADLETLVALVREHWSYLDDKSEHLGVDLDLMLATARAGLDGETDAAAWLEALERFAASMQDGHAGAFVPGAERPGLAWPFSVLPGADGLLVEGVVPATLAAMDTEPGDTVLAVDLVAAHELLSSAMRRTSASTLGARRAWAAQRLRRTDRARSRFLMQKPGGRLYELEYDAVPADAPLPVPAHYAPGITWRRLEEHTGLLRVGSLAAPDAATWKAAPPEQRDALLAPVYATFRRAFAELSGLDALVLDLRRNTGGTDQAGQELARYLVPPGSVYFGLSARDDDGDWRPVHFYPLPDEPPEHAFTGRLVVLIDAWTFSTADNLCACLEDSHPDVTFVGRPTAGGTGAPRAFTLPRTGASVTFCTMRVERPAGGLIEGRGTTPDVLVTWTAEDLAAGRDPDLEAALAFLGRTSAPER